MNRLKGDRYYEYNDENLQQENLMTRQVHTPLLGRRSIITAYGAVGTRSKSRGILQSLQDRTTHY